MTDSFALPRPVNELARSGVYAGRRVRRAIQGPAAEHGEAVRDDLVVSPTSKPSPVPLEDAVCRFRLVHEANEVLHRADGSWDPQPFCADPWVGTRVEEAALRVPGYLGAYDVTGESLYVERAEAAAEHLMRRVFADGHIQLRGHLIPDLPYSFVGCALLSVWERDPPARKDMFEKAAQIGDRLLEYPISGSVNHACAPVWLLSALYRHTGQERYLAATLKRVRRTALAFQLPDGVWSGHESWTWYHGITLRALVNAYVATPYFPKWYPIKDRMASAIYRAINHFGTGRLVDGNVQAHPSAESKERQQVTEAIQSQTARFRDGAFVHEPEGLHPEGGHELDALAAAVEGMGVAASVGHGIARGVLQSSLVRRLELDTLACGRYLALLREAQGFSGTSPEGAGASARPGIAASSVYSAEAPLSPAR